MAFVMNFICIGVDHHRANVAQREQLHLSIAQLKPLLKVIPSLELAIISTCNRVELYAATPTSYPLVDELLAYWSDVNNITPSMLSTLTTIYKNDKAIEHLLHVSSGLDSLVLGEPQILGQVTAAFEQAQSEHICGPILRAIFRSAICTGKRARTETHIGRNAASISSVAIQLADHTIGDLAGKKIVLIGAGKMGVLALKSLQAQRVGTISVVNRTRQHAQKIADQFSGQAYGFEHLQKLMGEADLVISSTGAPYTLLDSDFMKPVSATRNLPLVIIDIAVPRDVAADVGTLPNIRLFDIDALQTVIDQAMHQREKEIPSVKLIIADENAQLINKLQQLQARPTIAALHAQAETIRQREIKRLLRSTPHINEETKQQFELLSQSLVKKLLHAPTTKLREEAADGNAAIYTQAVRNLFDLNHSEKQD